MTLKINTLNTFQNQKPDPQLVQNSEDGAAKEIQEIFEQSQQGAAAAQTLTNRSPSPAPRSSLNVERIFQSALQAPSKKGRKIDTSKTRLCQTALDWSNPIGWTCLKTAFKLIPRIWLSISVMEWNFEIEKEWLTKLKTNLQNLPQEALEGLIFRSEIRLLSTKKLNELFKIGCENLKNIIVRCTPEIRDLLGDKKESIETKIGEGEILKIISMNLELNPNLDVQKLISLLTPLVMLLNDQDVHKVEHEVAIQVNFLKAVCECPGRRLSYGINPADNLIIFLRQLTGKDRRSLEPILNSCLVPDFLIKLYHKFNQLFSIKCSEFEEALNKLNEIFDSKLFQFSADYFALYHSYHRTLPEKLKILNENFDHNFLNIPHKKRHFFSFFHLAYNAIPEALVNFNLIFRRYFLNDCSKKEMLETLNRIFDKKLFILPTDLSDDDFHTFFYSLYCAIPTLLDKFNKIFDQLYSLKCTKETASSLLNDIFNTQIFEALPLGLGDKDYFTLFNSLFVAIRDFRNHANRRNAIQCFLWYNCGDAIYGFNPVLEKLPIYNEACKLLDSLPLLTKHDEAIGCLKDKLSFNESFAKSVYKTWWMTPYRRGGKKSIADRLVDWFVHIHFSSNVDCEDTVIKVKNDFHSTTPFLPFDKLHAENTFESLKKEETNGIITELMKVIFAKGNLTCNDAVEILKKKFHIDYPNKTFNRQYAEQAFLFLQQNT